MNNNIATIDSPTENRSLYCPVLMAVLWVFIGAVGAYDVYLSVKYHETLPFMELNPVGRMLIDWDCGGVAFFMGLKCFGTLSALGILQCLYTYRPRWALASAIVVASGQALLALFLQFG